MMSVGSADVSNFLAGRLGTKPMASLVGKRWVEDRVGQIAGVFWTQCVTISLSQINQKINISFRAIRYLVMTCVHNYISDRRSMLF